MRITWMVAVALVPAGGLFAAPADPPATLPAKPPETSPAAPTVTGPATRPDGTDWVAAASIEIGRKWHVVMTLKEGAGPAAIADEVGIAGGEPGQVGLWSPFFSPQGFRPGKLGKSGGFPGGWTFNAPSESDKAGRLTWSGATFAGRNGVEHIQVKVVWEQVDGTRSVYEGRGTPVQVGTSPRVVAAGHLLSVFGPDSGVRMRPTTDPQAGEVFGARFTSFEYDVGEGANRKTGVLRLFEKGGFWRPASDQPSPDMRPPGPK